MNSLDSFHSKGIALVELDPELPPHSLRKVVEIDGRQCQVDQPEPVRRLRRNLAEPSLPRLAKPRLAAHLNAEVLQRAVKRIVDDQRLDDRDIVLLHSEVDTTIEFNPDRRLRQYRVCSLHWRPFHRFLWRTHHSTSSLVRAYSKRSHSFANVSTYICSSSRSRVPYELLRLYPSFPNGVST